MTDVRDGGGARGPRMWDEPGQDLDELLTRWGSEQSGPFRRPAPTSSGGRHAAPDAPAQDPLAPAPRPAPPTARPPAPEPPAHRAPRPDPTPGRPSGPAVPRSSRPAPHRPAPHSPAPSSATEPAAHRPDPPAGRPQPPARSGWSGPAAAPGPERPRPEHPSWPGQAVRVRSEQPSGPGGPAGRARVEHPSWPSSGRPIAGAAGPPAAGPTGGGRRRRPDGVPPAWEQSAAPNGPGTAAPAGPPHLDGTRAAWAAGHPAGPGPAGVGVLERVPDRYGLLTHDLDGHPQPAPGDRDEWEDETPGRHRRPGARPARARRPRWLRTLRWVGLATAVLLLLGGGFGVYQYRKLSGNINRIDALAPDDASIRDAGRQLDAQNYLLIGSDTRAGANGRYEDGAGQVTGERSDTTILAHLSPDRSKATLVSFPRDAWVSLPECRRRDGTIEPARDGQFNEAFAAGGPACTVLAVQKLTGIKINHYVQVDFTGFKTMVDAVGGVPICTPVPLRDKESGLRMDPGTTRLRGEQALAYVRARYGIGNGSDLGRIERQQRFLGAMVRSATSVKLLANPVALTKFLGAATKSLTLDRETSFGDLKALADQLNGLDPKKVTFLTAPIADAAYNPPGFPPLRPGQGGSKVLLDDAAGRVLWDSIINDRPAPPKGSPAPRPRPNVLTVAPEEVTVRVLNGVGTSGLGATVSTALAGAGFSLVEPTNAPPTTATTVRYGPAQAEQARTLAAAVPGAVLQPDAGTTLDLVVGANYTGVKRVQPGDPSTARPAATPPRPAATGAKPVTAADATCT